MNVQRIETPVVLNPRDIEENPVKALRQLAVAVVQIADDLNVLKKHVEDHDRVINGTESTVNT